MVPGDAINREFNSWWYLLVRTMFYTSPVLFQTCLGAVARNCFFPQLTSDWLLFENRFNKDFLPGEILIGAFIWFFIIQGFKYNLNTTNNENDFWNISCTLQLLQGTFLLLRTTELFPWEKSIHVCKINRPSALAVFISCGCIRNCIVNYFF